MRQFSVTGMSCAACSTRVEKVVSAVDGVESCTVSLLTNSMAVEGNAASEDIIKAVKNAGYGAAQKAGSSTHKEKISCTDGAEAGSIAGTCKDALEDHETPVLKKRLFALLLAVLMLLSLSACSSMEDDLRLLLQGNLDEVYLGKYDEEYMEMVGSSLEDCIASYNDGIALKAEHFCYSYDIEYPTDSLMDEIEELFKDIYSHSKYQIGEIEKLDKGLYVAQFTVWPIDIIERTDNSLEAGLEDFYAKYAGVDVEAMTDAEYYQYDADWAEAVLNVVYKEMENIGYKDPLKFSVQLIKNINDVWTIDENDFRRIAENIIYYPW